AFPSASMRSKSVTLAPIFACGSPDIATDESTSSPNETHIRELDVFGIGFHSFQVAPRAQAITAARCAVSKQSAVHLGEVQSCGPRDFIRIHGALVSQNCGSP